MQRTWFQTKWAEWLVVLLLFGLALFLRTYRLETIPPGLFNDEAANGLDARAVLAGAHPIFFERNSGREPIFIYLQAAMMALIGQTPLALRLTAALIGALTIPATYWLVRELFAESDRPVRSLALWSALFLAISYWPLSINRLAFRANLLPLLATVTFALFWHGWHRLWQAQRFPWLSLIATGLGLGLSLYTYTAARFLPFVFLVLFAASWRQAQQSAETRRRYWRAVLLIVGCSALTFAPLAVYFMRHPDQFIERAATVSVFAQADTFVTGIRSLGISVVKTIGLFGFVPDPNVRHDPAIRPLFPWFMGGWLVVGTLWALWRVRSLSTLFLLSWAGLLALPAMMTTEGSPHSLRALGMIPAVYILAIAGMVAVGRWLLRRRFLQLALWLPLPFVVLTAYTDINDYFAAWQHETRFSSAFFTHYIELGAALAAHSDGNTQWIFALSPNHFPPETELYTIDFLYGRQMHTVYAMTDPATISAKFASALDSGEPANLLRPQADVDFPDAVYTLGDPKSLVKFLLDKYALKIDSQSAATVGMPYLVYALPPAATYAVSGPLTAQNITFGERVTLIGDDYGRVAAEALAVSNNVAIGDLLKGDVESKQVPSGGALWVLLRWRAETPLELDLKSALYLVDGQGHRVAQSDELLVGDGYPVERRWAAGEATNSYHILPLLSAIPPGTYTLMVRLYEDQTLQQYPAADSAATNGDLALTTVEVVRAAMPPTISPAVTAGVDAQFDATLQLLGYDALPTTTAPGDTVSVTAYWQALQTITADYTTQLQLRTNAGQPIATASAPASIGGHYGTSQWAAQEIVRAWHEFTVPVTVENGDYQLVLLVSRGGEPVGERLLGTLTVAGRPHRFDPLPLTTPASAAFGDQVRLVGIADVAPEAIAAGGQVQLCLVWQPLRPTTEALTRFVHLLNDSGQVVAQQDTVPCQSACPSTSWVANEYLCDELALALPADLPAGTYHLATGWYESTSLERLPAFDANGNRQQDDLLVLPTSVTVK